MTSGKLHFDQEANPQTPNKGLSQSDKCRHPTYFTVRFYLVLRLLCAHILNYSHDDSRPLPVMTLLITFPCLFTAVYYIHTYPHTYDIRHTYAVPRYRYQYPCATAKTRRTGGQDRTRPKFRSQQGQDDVDYGMALHSPDALPGGLGLSGVRT